MVESVEMENGRWDVEGMGIRLLLRGWLCTMPLEKNRRTAAEDRAMQEKLREPHGNLIVNGDMPRRWVH